jgi:hypothetical protein
MDKIFNNPKINVYAGVGMLNKYIYMKREDNDNKLYFIYKINSIINEKFPVIYGCDKMYILVVPKNQNQYITVKDNINSIELLNNDILYQMSIDEYIGIFKSFVEYQGTKTKITDDMFEN